MVLWVGGTAVAEGRLSLGALVAFNGYLAYLAWPTMALGWTWSIVRRGLTSMGRLLEITAPAPALPERGHPLQGPLGLRFARLTFAYDGREPALRDVSFSVEPGEKVAVVGATGSGKSTLGLLVARLWEPPPGDGVRERPRRARHSPRRPARGPRLRAPGGLSVLAVDPGQRDPRSRRRLVRSMARAAARAAGIADRDRRVRRRLGHRGGRARPDPLGRPAPAGGPGARARRRARPADPGRRLLQRRRGQGGGDRRAGPPRRRLPGRPS